MLTCTILIDYLSEMYVITRLICIINNNMLIYNKL